MELLNDGVAAATTSTIRWSSSSVDESLVDEVTTHVSGSAEVKRLICSRRCKEDLVEIVGFDEDLVSIEEWESRSCVGSCESYEDRSRVVRACLEVNTAL